MSMSSVSRFLSPECCKSQLGKIEMAIKMIFIYACQTYIQQRLGAMLWHTGQLNLDFNRPTDMAQLTLTLREADV
jgi:hypothetical protein